MEDITSEYLKLQDKILDIANDIANLGDKYLELGKMAWQLGQKLRGYQSPVVVPEEDVEQ